MLYDVAMFYVGCHNIIATLLFYTGMGSRTNAEALTCVVGLPMLLYKKFGQVMMYVYLCAL